MLLAGSFQAFVQTAGTFQEISAQLSNESGTKITLENWTQLLDISAGKDEIKFAFTTTGDGRKWGWRLIAG